MIHAMFARCSMCLALMLATVVVSADEPQTGPATEKRFPPLVVPEGFKATLFACDPLVEYPSVIALGPRAGSMFVAHDYMTGLGVDIVRRDEIRLLFDSDGDGYADKSVVYAGGFNSIQGLAYHDGTVYAMHAPVLTALRDTNDDGIADERRNLLTGLGLLPEKNPTRLHCANGVTVGNDGWLYLSMGDNGTDVTRPEGDRLLLQAGGILRCRTSGADLHVFATGLRNIYDVALDAQQNVFVRDNENDGGNYLLRIYHSIHGADHGYPYLYYEHSDEAVLPLADLGRGSSAGGVCYLETAFPPEMHGNLFFCEWGRAVVRAERQPLGSGFGPTKETDFAASAPSDPYGFKPTDVIVDRDGSILISDWCDGQRPKRGRGRIYRVTYTASDQKPTTETSASITDDVGRLLAELNSSSHFRRTTAQAALECMGLDRLPAVRSALQEQKLNATARTHAIWLLAKVGGRESASELLGLAETDVDATVRGAAVRAVGDLTDPQLTAHRLDAGPGDSAIAGRLAALTSQSDPRVLLEIVVCLGRLKWSGTPGFLRDKLQNPDQTLAHAAQQTLRRCGNWAGVLPLLDEPAESPLRRIALRAIADQADMVIVDGLIERLRAEGDASRRGEYAESLVRVHQKPGPWVYWGYRPGPRPANSVKWERTEKIAEVLNSLLADPSREVRLANLQRMQREQVPVLLPSLAGWLKEERDAIHVAAIVEALSKQPNPDVRGVLEQVIPDKSYTEASRLKSLVVWIEKLDAGSESQLVEMANRVEDGAVLERLIQEFGLRPQLDTRSLLISKLQSPAANVRAAAVAALSQLKHVEAVNQIVPLLKDPAPQVRRAAATAVGQFDVASAAETLLGLARDNDAETRSASLQALRVLHVASAVPAALEALKHPASQAAGIAYLSEFSDARQTAALVEVASTSRSSETLASSVQALANWETRAASPQQTTELQGAISRLQGDSGTLLQWRASEKLSTADADQLREKIFSAVGGPAADIKTGWRSLLAAGAEQRVDLGMSQAEDNQAAWLAFSDVSVPDAATAQFLGSSNGPFRVWLNGQSVFDRSKPGSAQSDSDRFEAPLNKGANRIVIQMPVTQGIAQFQLHFRRKGSSADHERLAQLALQDSGNIERGRELFFNSEKSLCMKCHRLQDQGGLIGPDLTGIGGRFARIHLVESILEPSRTIAPSYETVTVALTSGRVVTGVKVTESESRLVLGDDQGKTHDISRSEIEDRITQTRSTMPDGLEKRLTDREFLDLVTFLVSQKKSANRP